MASPKFSSYLCLLFLLSGPEFAHADSHENYDTPPVRKAREILPADLIKGEHFTVRDGITWNDGLHEFTVDTKFGSFDVWGEPMLRVRLAEVDAWVALVNTSSAEMGAKSIGRSTISKVGSLANAFAHPVKTVTGVPKGVGRLFRKADHTVESVGDTVSEDEEEGKSGELDQEEEGATVSLGNKLIGVNAAYRRLALEYGVNPYTSNEAIQEELLRLAKVQAVASKSSSILMPGIGTALTVVAKVTTSIYEESWLEIVAGNEYILVEMGASPDQIKALFKNDAINLTLLTLMIQILQEMVGVEGRINVVDQLILLETEAEAVFFAESLLMADWYKDNESPLAEMLPGTLVPVVLTLDGKLIVFTAADYAYWTPKQASVAVEFTQLYKEYSSQREAWIADQASPRFVEGIGALGWVVRSDMRASVLPEIPWGLSDDQE